MIGRISPARAVLIVVTIFALLFALDDVYSAGSNFKCVPKVTVYADVNNTVWSIVENNCTGNLSAAQDAIVSKYGTTIYPGQVLELPSSG